MREREADYEIIDFHVHPYLSEEENFCMYREDFSLTPDEAAKDLRRAGICHVCGSVLSREPFDPGRGFEQLRLLNERALQVKEKYGDFYTPGFHIHPAFVKESLETVEWMHQNGFRLIGELVPYMHGWAETGMDFASPGLREILALAGEYGMVVSYHTMTEQQEQMEAMIAENPAVTFVAAHPGEREYFLKHLQRLEKYENANPENVHVLTELVGEELEIIDPYGGTLQAYGLCYETMRKTIKKLVNLLNEEE